MHFQLDLFSQTLYFVFWNVDDTTSCCNVHHLPPPFQVVHATWEKQRDRHTGHSGETLWEVHGPGGVWERTWWVHLRFWHHVLWQWFRHWLEFYSKCCNLIGQLLGTSACELRRNGTAAYFLSSIADYRPLYTFITQLFMNLPLFVYQSESRLACWKMPGVRSSAADVVQLMLHAVASC